MSFRAWVAALLVIAFPAQAQRVVDLTAATLHTPDGGTENVLSGAWLDDAQLAATAKQSVELKTRNAQLEAHAGDMPGRWVAGAFIIGVLLGGGVVAGVIAARGGLK